MVKAKQAMNGGNDNTHSVIHLQRPDTHHLAGWPFHLTLFVLQLIPLIMEIETNTNIVCTATLCCIAGAYRSIRPVAKGVTETMTKTDAQRFPLVGSCVLFSMFLLFKYLPKDALNALLTVYFVALGVLAIVQTFTPVLARTMPIGVATRRVNFGTVPVIKYINEDGPFLVSFDVAEIVTGVAAIFFCKWYYETKHFLANNTLGLSFALQGIEMLTLDSIQVGCILLIGLFFYDIFWVFFTPVMVSVAKSFDAPIKLLFPRGPINVLDSSKRPFSMLGLGDIVIPGLYLALILRMDIKRKEAANRPRTRSKARELKKKPPPMYFWTVTFGYALGLITTIAVMNIFEAAQPALLYIVPGLLLTTFFRALFAGEVKKIWAYNEQNGSVCGDIVTMHED